jgi:hypothetical protein
MLDGLRRRPRDPRHGLPEAAELVDLRWEQVDFKTTRLQSRIDVLPTAVGVGDRAYQLGRS